MKHGVNTSRHWTILLIVSVVVTYWRVQRTRISRCGTFKSVNVYASIEVIRRLSTRVTLHGVDLNFYVVAATTEHYEYDLHYL